MTIPVAARRPRFRLRVERLEVRATPCASLLPGADEYNPMMVAGDPNGSPADSPSARVDANTPTSPFAGVGSVQVNTRRGTYIGTGTPISPRHILTAGHVVDINGDGRLNNKDGVTNTYFNLNTSSTSTRLLVSSITVHPNFTGFARPSVNDDLAILTLAEALPSGLPIYALPTIDLADRLDKTLTMVGYGRSGNGVSGYTTNASFTVKRKGENNADAFEGQDDAGQTPANEVFKFDFDGPTGTGTFGGSTLGNARETTLGGGDSGGPSFTGNTVVGVNTFTQGFSAPRFGSLGGGINVFPYVGWINSVLGGGSGFAAATTPTAAGGDSTVTKAVDIEVVSVAWDVRATAVATTAERLAAEPVAVKGEEFLGGIAVDIRPTAGSPDRLALVIPVTRSAAAVVDDLLVADW